MTDRTSPDSARLDELEMRVVHQDQTIEDLNAAITAQWKLIERLERQVARLAERVADSERSTGDAAPVDRPPPHY
jgi:SlyX protein